MRLTLNENEIKDAIIRSLTDKVGKLYLSREDIRLQDVGVGSVKLIAEIEVEFE